MLKIGITGGIGSGKSTIANKLINKGFHCFNLDNIAKSLANTNINLMNEIIQEFGNDAYIDINNSVNKNPVDIIIPNNENIYLINNRVYYTNYIGNIVFSDKNKLKRLNDIFKPYIESELNNPTFNKPNPDYNKDYIFYESALIFENNIEHKFDFILCAYADKETIINRIKLRDNLTEEQINNRLNNQISPIIKSQQSNWVINTNTNIDADINNINIDKQLNEIFLC